MDQRLFAPTQGLTQLITSFIASMSLGIRHTPLFTFFRHIHTSSQRCKHRWKNRMIGCSYFQLYCLVDRHLKSIKCFIKVHLNFYFTLQFCLCQYVKDRLSWNSSFIIHNSYFCGYEMNLHAYEFKTEVENNGFEPLTPCLQSRCSSQLS